eukprot:TRINITY_DN2103_c1_g1_i1.p1 TRINITY_DN2103_c1_g1~~TRINITY_DN2103_c1_g1_i1.p1  ORF type:complete len:343 (+),score=-20.51 TRINITY_DN2103_c1_g1_i1:292-1320(+)
MQRSPKNAQLNQLSHAYIQLQNILTQQLELRLHKLLKNQNQIYQFLQQSIHVNLQKKQHFLYSNKVITSCQTNQNFQQLLNKPVHSFMVQQLYQNNLYNCILLQLSIYLDSKYPPPQSFQFIQISHQCHKRLCSKQQQTKRSSFTSSQTYEHLTCNGYYYYYYLALFQQSHNLHLSILFQQSHNLHLSIYTFLWLNQKAGHQFKYLVKSISNLKNLQVILQYHLDCKFYSSKLFFKLFELEFKSNDQLFNSTSKRCRREEKFSPAKGKNQRSYKSLRNYQQFLLKNIRSRLNMNKTIINKLEQKICKVLQVNHACSAVALNIISTLVDFLNHYITYVTVQIL